MIAEQQWIYFYIWYHLERPIYVGQSVDPEKRAESHAKSVGKFGQFIRANECSYEILSIKVWDICQGHWANGIENGFMDLYKTRWPDGFNRQRAFSKGITNFAKLGAIRTQALYPGLAAENGRRFGRRAALRMHELHPEVAKNFGKLALIGAKRCQELHPNQLSEMGKKGGTRTKELHPEEVKKWASKAARVSSHNRWHLRRGIKKPGCALCEST